MSPDMPDALAACGVPLVAGPAPNALTLEMTVAPDLAPHTAAAYIALKYYTAVNRAPRVADLPWLVPQHTEEGMRRKGVPYFNTLALMRCPPIFQVLLRACVARVQEARCTALVAFETRAMAFAAAIAAQCDIPFVPARKTQDTVGVHVLSVCVTPETSYRSDTIIALDSEALRPHDVVALFDDVVATGATTAALASLIRSKCAIVHTIALIHCTEPSKGILQCPTRLL